MDEEAVFQQVVLFKDRGEWAAARAAFEPLLRRRPPRSGYFWFLGMLYQQEHRLGDALESFRCAAALAPRSERASLGIFHCLWKMDRCEEAIKEIERFLTIADSEDYRANLAELTTCE